MPPGAQHLSHGAFLYSGRKVGEMPLALKLAVKAKNYYYAPGKGFSDGRVPHESGNRYIVFNAMERLEAKYGDIPWTWVTADNPTLAREAMFKLLDQGVDTLILGCTHYPILKPVVANVMGPDVRLVDSALVLAEAVAADLDTTGDAADRGRSGELQLLVTDVPQRFGELSRRFLAREVPPVEVVDLEAHSVEVERNA